MYPCAFYSESLNQAMVRLWVSLDEVKNVDGKVLRAIVVTLAEVTSHCILWVLPIGSIEVTSEAFS